MPNPVKPIRKKVDVIENNPSGASNTVMARINIPSNKIHFQKKIPDPIKMNTCIKIRAANRNTAMPLSANKHTAPSSINIINHIVQDIPLQI